MWKSQVRELGENYPLQGYRLWGSAVVFFYGAQTVLVSPGVAGYHNANLKKAKKSAPERHNNC